MRRAFLAIVALFGVACGAGAPDVPDIAPTVLDARLAARFLALPLECVERPYPNKPGHVYAKELDLQPPRIVTPAFYGCFDWHSAVHGHWSMVRLLSRFPEVEGAREARKLLAAHLSEGPLGEELSFLEEKRNRLFERPYGWGWLLRLAAELRAWKDPAAPAMREALKPLEAHLVAASRDYLKRLSAPIRVGTHANTAFALAHMLDYAAAAGDEDFAAELRERARGFYLDDRNCPTAYEPSGEDFLSPCLGEADVMRRVLPPDEFSVWLGAFLPAPASREFRSLLAPIEVRDRKDPRIGHLIGLWFHRAWCLRGIASALPEVDPRRLLFERIARLHVKTGLEQMFDSGYGGAHWLASFALLAMP